MANTTEELLSIGANLVALTHISYFLFVLGGAVAVILGHVKCWDWVRGPWFRFIHLIAVYIVLIEEVTGIPCILNLLQWSLRSNANGEDLATDGVGGVLDFLLYGTISPVALDIFYWSMGALVLSLLWKVPMRFQSRAEGEASSRAA